MHKGFQTMGFVLMIMGISGAIDHLARQPIFGVFLNFFNRTVIPRIDALTGYELFANLVIAVAGVIIMAAPEMFRR